MPLTTTTECGQKLRSCRYCSHGVSVVIIVHLYVVEILLKIRNNVTRCDNFILIFFVFIFSLFLVIRFNGMFIVSSVLFTELMRVFSVQ